MILRSFQTVIVSAISAIVIESLNTTEEYAMIESGTLVVCPPATNRALRRKFSHLHIENEMTFNLLIIDWGFVHWLSQTSNAGPTFFNSFMMASHRKVLPFAASIMRGSRFQTCGSGPDFDPPTKTNCF